MRSRKRYEKEMFYYIAYLYGNANFGCPGTGGNLKEVINYFHTTSSAYPVSGYKINRKKCSKTVFYNIYNKYMVNGHYLY